MINLSVLILGNLFWCLENCWKTVGKCLGDDASPRPVSEPKFFSSPREGGRTPAANWGVSELDVFILENWGTSWGSNMIQPLHLPSKVMLVRKSPKKTVKQLTTMVPSTKNKTWLCVFNFGIHVIHCSGPQHRRQPRGWSHAFVAWWHPRHLWTLKIVPWLIWFLAKNIKDFRTSSWGLHFQECCTNFKDVQWWINVIKRPKILNRTKIIRNGKP